MKMVAVNFAEWMHKNGYLKYWGSDAPNSDKWYVSYTPPDRKYYTTDELYELFILDERERLKTLNKADVIKSVCDCGCEDYKIAEERKLRCSKCKNLRYEQTVL